MTRDWNATSYERVSAPIEAMGRDVLDRLELRGDERVLDAGCGTGRVTAALLERLPRGHVVAVDGSPAMVGEAKARLGPGVEAFVADLTELELETPVDAILSTATFHWIADHERLFARLYAALTPGGRLVAQCGGEGNVAAVQEAIARVNEPGLAGWAGPWNFASPAVTEQRLVAAGFTDVWTWRQHVHVEPEDPHEYFATVMLGSHLERLDPERRAGFVEAVLRNVIERELAERAHASPRNVAEGEFAERNHLAGETSIKPAADYVRLNILARRPT
jgi:trans-aconitate 2-methyltransferase